MAEKVKQTGIIIAIIAGITLPTLAIAWAGGGRLARVEVVANDAKAGVELITGEVKVLTKDFHRSELRQTEINTKLSAIPEMKRDLRKLTEHLMKFDYHKLEEDK